MDRSPAKNVEDNTILSNITDDINFNEFEEPIDPHADDVEAQRQARELSKDPHYVPSNEV
jgi:hypothetical protein